MQSCHPGLPLEECHDELKTKADNQPPTYDVSCPFGISKPKTLGCLDTATFIAFYTTWCVAFGMYMQYKSADLQTAALYAVPLIFPLCGLYGSLYASRTMLLIYGCYLLGGCMLLSGAFLLGASSLFRSDVCELLGSHLGSDQFSLVDCEENIVAARVAFVLGMSLMAVVQGFMLLEVKKLYDYVNSTTWNDLEKVDLEGYPGKSTFFLSLPSQKLQRNDEKQVFKTEPVMT